MKFGSGARSEAVPSGWLEAASRASSDHLARAWHRTYGLPVVITKWSNNFGPRQHAEKLIPTMVRNAFAGKPLPVYGDGSNIRDWLYVEDHCRGLLLAAARGRPGESYCFGSGNGLPHIAIVRMICELLDEKCARIDGKSYAEQISFVADRPGHDWRYAIDFTKARGELGFRVSTPFREGMRKTVHALTEALETTSTSRT